MSEKYKQQCQGKRQTEVDFLRLLPRDYAVEQSAGERGCHEGQDKKKDMYAR